MMVHMTKAWEGDWQEVLEKLDSFLPRLGPRWVIANNLEDRIEVIKAFRGKVDRFIVAEDYEKKALEFFNVTLGQERPYSVSELVGMYLAKDFEYLTFYASDIEISDHTWIKAGLALLDDTIVTVSPGWQGDALNPSQEFEDWVVAEKTIYPELIEVYDWGCSTPFFSDQAFLARVDTLRQPIYNFEDNFIASKYPWYGGNTFERRVGQFLAQTGKRKAILKDWNYVHETKPH